MATSRIGELLIAEGLLTESAVHRAVGFQRVSGEHLRLGTILMSWELLGEEQLLSALAKLHRCPAVAWEILSAADRETVRLLPAAQAIRLGAMPYAAESGWIRAAFANPSDLAKIDELAAVTGRRVVAAVTTELRLLQAHHRFYGRHVPLPFRSILQKLERRDAERKRAVAWVGEIDFRSRDVRRVSDTAGSRSAARLERVESPESLPGIALPPLPPPGFDSVPAAKSSRPITITGEDSLTRWVSDALTAFQKESVSAESQPAPPAEASIAEPPANAATIVGPGHAERPEPSVVVDPIEDMWRPSPDQDASELIALAMWNPVEPVSEIATANSAVRQRIVQSVLDTFLAEFPRVLVFGAGKRTIDAWGGRGPNLPPARIAALRVDAEERSLFSSVEEWSPHFGPVADGDWPQPLAGALGSAAPPCAVFPIRVADDVGGFLYADRLGAPMRQDDFAALARAAAAATELFSKLLLSTAAAARV